MLNLSAHDEEIENMLDKFEWVFLPVSNVDGFSFTHEVRAMNITLILNEGMKMGPYGMRMEPYLKGHCHGILASFYNAKYDPVSMETQK